MSVPFGSTDDHTQKNLEALASELAHHIKSEQDIASLSRQLLKLTVETALGAEMESHLGYGKYASKGQGSGNSRNGYSRKTLKNAGRGPVRTNYVRDRAPSDTVLPGRAPIPSLSNILCKCHPRVYFRVSGKRSSNSIANRFKARFQSRIGIVHFGAARSMAR